jgi:catechol 2,3-dioxygenase-like lactoylglutathione lyase family enzyme
MLKKIDHICVVVNDIEKAKQFFIAVGFIVNPDREGPIGGPWIDKVTNLLNVSGYYCTLTIPGADTNLELIRYDSPTDASIVATSKPNQLGIRHLAFEVKNIEEIVAKLKKRGVNFFSEIQDYTESNKKICYFYGPDDIILELAEYK